MATVTLRANIKMTKAICQLLKQLTQFLSDLEASFRALNTTFRSILFKGIVIDLVGSLG
jgi:hypothetical protein